MPTWPPRRRSSEPHDRRRRSASAHRLPPLAAAVAFIGLWLCRHVPPAARGAAGRSCRLPARRPVERLLRLGPTAADARGLWPDDAGGGDRSGLAFVIGSCRRADEPDDLARADAVPVRRRSCRRSRSSPSRRSSSEIGFSTTSQVVICVIISVFPIIANTLFGLKSATAGQHDLFTLQTPAGGRGCASSSSRRAVPAIYTGCASPPACR